MKAEIVTEKVSIINNQEIAPDYFKLTFWSPKIAELAKPMQFVGVNFLEPSSIILPRPFSIYHIENEQLTILYKVIGKATKLFSQMKIGENLILKGPLGKTVETPNKKNKIALVAGGVGIASLRFLIEKFKFKFDLFYGVKTQQEFLELDFWQKLASKVFLTAETGYNNFSGYITEILEAEISNYDVIYTCGPKPMLKKVSEIAQKNKVKHYVVLEEMMACGYGLCMGCVVKTKQGYLRVCQEGTVFNGDDIIW